MSQFNQEYTIENYFSTWFLFGFFLCGLQWFSQKNKDEKPLSCLWITSRQCSPNLAWFALLLITERSKLFPKDFFFQFYNWSLKNSNLKRQLGFYLIVRTCLDFPNRYIKRSSTEHTQLSKMNNDNVKSKQACSSTNTQLPGRLFSPSDKWKNYPSTFYCIFHLVWVPRKILGCIY